MRRAWPRGSTPSSTGSCRAPWPCWRSARCAWATTDASPSTRPRRPRCPGRDARCCRSPTRPGCWRLARELVTREVELVSTGGTATGAARGGPAGDRRGRCDRLPRDAGRPRQDGPPADPRRRPGRPRLAEHRGSWRHAVIAPFEFVVVNLYPFEAAAERPAITLDELIEEIDIGGPALVRAAAKNHASVAVLTSPDQYGPVIEELERDGAVGEATRRRLAVAAFRRTNAYDGRIAAELGRRLGAERSTRRWSAGETLPARLVLDLERVQPLRYGENPHQVAALYRRPDAPAGSGPFAAGVDLRQGKALSYNNLLDAAAAAGVARDLPGPPPSSSSTRTRAARPRATTSCRRGTAPWPATRERLRRRGSGDAPRGWAARRAARGDLPRRLVLLSRRCGGPPRHPARGPPRWPASGSPRRARSRARAPGRCGTPARTAGRAGRRAGGRRARPRAAPR